jgi:hypothetical protein
MTNRLHGRVAQLEAAGKDTASYVVTIPPEALDDPAATAAAIAEHRERTGYTGPVILAPPEATSVEEWSPIYGPGGGA